MSGDEMTEVAGIEEVDATRRRRVPVIGLVAGCLLVVALAALWVRVADPFNPYRPGTTHSATLSNKTGYPPCYDGWTVNLGSGSRQYYFNGGVAPTDWYPGPVTGILHITGNYSRSGTDAIFEARGESVDLTGGRADGKHFSDLGCSVWPPDQAPPTTAAN